MPVVLGAHEGAVCRVQLNRPDKLNALSDQVRQELHAILVDLADRPEIRVVVIEGKGRAFSAGADLAGRAARTADTAVSSSEWAVRRHAMGGWQRLLDLLESIPQVTLARLHGHCIGGAALLASACDLRIGDTTLVVRIPELAIGIPLTWNGVPRLAREIGLPLARDLVMTGRTMEAPEAKQAGFVQRLVPEGELDAAVETAVAELLAMPAAPLAITRSMFGAIGRERAGVAGWADADLLGWSGREPESVEAAAAYTAARLRPNG